MGFLDRIFGKKKPAVIKNYTDFWKWFKQNEQVFYKTVKEHDKVNEIFLSKLTPHLQQLNEDFYCVTGMLNDDTAELVITTDGSVKDFVFAEDFIAEAPAIKGWKFTALKPACDIESMGVKMEGYDFDESNISFYSNDHHEYPDEIDITLVHNDYTEQNKETISSGSLIYLDNMLGEYNSAIMLDTVLVEGPSPGDIELIPIEKLPGYLKWRQNEFVEKYDGVRYGTEEDAYASLEAEDEEGLPVFAIVNQDLINWDAKASHPWMMLIEIKYDGKSRNGLPDEPTSELMNAFEEELLKQLPDADGYLNIGRETYKDTRTIYVACKEFRRSSKTTASLINEYNGKLAISYDIFKDKYWTVVNHLL